MRNANTARRLILALTVTCFLILSACHKSQPKVAKRHPFTGRVVSIDALGKSAAIENDNLPGVMDPMTMVYTIKPQETLKQLSPGDSISADFIIEPDDDNGRNDSWLENVKVTAHGKPTSAPAASLHMPAPGEDVPDFSFTNQNGKRISLQQYRGETVLITFIYTRCPFPDFCPRMSSNFAEIYKQVGTSPVLAHAHLLSISFDPEHDTPKVLRDYGFRVAHTHEAALFSRWEFAVPAAADLPRITDFFALTVKPEGGMITHNLSTAVIGPDGKIVKWYHGSDWQVSDLIRDATGAVAR